MKEDKILKILNPIFNLPNSKGEKGYIGSRHIQLPVKDHDARNIDTIRRFAVAFLSEYGNKKAEEPSGSDDKVFNNDKFNSFVKKTFEDSASLKRLSARRFKKQTLPEFERFGLITRKTYSKGGPIYFNLTPISKKIAKLSNSINTIYYEKLLDCRKEYVRNRFHKNADWSEFYEAVYQHTNTFKYLHWFDLWLLAFSIGENAIFDYDQIHNFSIELRNAIGINGGLMAEKLSEFKNFLEKKHSPFGSQQFLAKNSKVNIPGIIEKYNIFAEYLTYTGLYKKENSGHKFILTFADNTNPPKTVRNNTTDKSLYYQSELDKLTTENHHILPHALATQMNGLNDDINNKWNKLSISERDHNKFPTQLIKNQYRIIDVVNDRICFINTHNPNDVIILEDDSHINKEMVKSKVIPYNKQLLKKIK